MAFKKLVYLLLLFIVSFPLKAMEIKGTIKLQDDWQPVVFLASLNSPENLFVASPDFVIAKTFIQPDGSFSIQTSSIPEDEHFYRLYLVKGNNSSVEFNTSIQRNFIHLILDQNTTIVIDAKVEDNTFSVIQLLGSEQNSAVLKFDEEIAKRKQQFTSTVTKTKRDYLTKDLEGFIRNFVETQQSAIVGLYALYHLEEKDTDFLRNSDFYFNFQEKLEAQYPNSYYAQEYAELLKSLIGFRDLVCEIPGLQPKWKDNLLIAQGVFILILFFVIILLITKSRKILVKLNEKNGKSQNSFTNLTQKEREILKLLAAGKTNKEIAQELYIELSTVKTHINSIYKQLQLSGRKEAVEYYKALSL